MWTSIWVMNVLRICTLIWTFITHPLIYIHQKKKSHLKSDQSAWVHSRLDYQPFPECRLVIEPTGYETTVSQIHVRLAYLFFISTQTIGPDSGTDWYHWSVLITLGSKELKLSRSLGKFWKKENVDALLEKLLAYHIVHSFYSHLFEDKITYV